MSWSSPADQSSFANSASETWTVQKVLIWSAGWLKEKGVDRDATNHRLEVELLLSNILGLERTQLYMQLDKPLAREERDLFKAQLRRRVDGEPISYILGIKHFYRHAFKVTRAVLIPRADTEILVERSLELLKGMDSPSVLDVGTGSGCIAISVALEIPTSSVEGWDKSREALAVATENSRDLKVQNLVLREQDLFKADSAGPFNLIISNPPYIATYERDSLSIAVREFEPADALFDGQDGLSFYRDLATKAVRWLRPGGALVVECGHTQAQAVCEIFRQNQLHEVSVSKDLAGHERVVSGRCCRTRCTSLICA